MEDQHDSTVSDATAGSLIWQYFDPCEPPIWYFFPEDPFEDACLVWEERSNDPRAWIVNSINTIVRGFDPYDHSWLITNGTWTFVAWATESDIQIQIYAIDGNRTRIPDLFYCGLEPIDVLTVSFSDPAFLDKLIEFMVYRDDVFDLDFAAL